MYTSAAWMPLRKGWRGAAFDKSGVSAEGLSNPLPSMSSVSSSRDSGSKSDDLRVRAMDASEIVKRRRRNPEFIEDFVAQPAFLYGFQLAWEQFNVLFPSRVRFPFPRIPFEGTGILVGSQNRQLLIAGGRLCVILVERLLCLNGRPSHIRDQLKLANAIGRRRHFFEGSTATCVATLAGHCGGVNSVAL